MSIKETRDKMKAEMALRFRAVPYFPGQSCSDHGLMRAFTFTPRTLPVQTEESEDAWKRVKSAEEDLKRLMGCAAVADDAPFFYNDTEEKDTNVGLSVASTGAKKIAGTAGATREVNKATYARIDNIQRHYLNDSADALGLGEFLKKFACQYVSADVELQSILMSNQMEYGRQDAIVGFERSYVTGNVSEASFSSQGATGLGVSASAGPVDCRLGASHEFAKSRKSSPDEGMQNVVIGSRFMAVHLQRRVAGTGTGEIRMLTGPINITDLNSPSLKKMFQNAFPTLIERAGKKGRTVFGKIFRKSANGEVNQQGNMEVGGALESQEEGKEEPDGHDEANQQDNMDVGGALESHEGKEEADDDDDLRIFFSVDEEGEQLYEDQNINNGNTFDNAFQGSWNYIVTLKRKAFAKIQSELAQHGTTMYGNLPITNLSLVHKYDLSDFIPIYFNWEANQDCNPLEVPSAVICYNPPSDAGSWCLRPVEGGKNKVAVTSFNEDWELHESIVRVSTGDTHLQAELSKIGFHVVEEGQGEGLGAIEGSIMMGRQELTRKSYPATIPGIELEFHDGILCTSESGVSGTGAAGSTRTGMDATSSILPPVPVVTSTTIGSPGRKKQKNDHSSTEPH